MISILPLISSSHCLFSRYLRTVFSACWEYLVLSFCLVLFSQNCSEERENKIDNMLILIDFGYWLVCWLVGWFIGWFYGVSTLFGSFNAKWSHFDKSFKPFSFVYIQLNLKSNRQHVNIRNNIFLLINSKSSLLAKIPRSVGLSNSLRILCVAFSRIFFKFLDIYLLSKFSVFSTILSGSLFLPGQNSDQMRNVKETKVCWPQNKTERMWKEG